MSGVSGLHAQQLVEKVLRQDLEHAHLMRQRTKKLSLMNGHAILKHQFIAVYCIFMEDLLGLGFTQTFK